MRKLIKSNVSFLKEKKRVSGGQEEEIRLWRIEHRPQTFLFEAQSRFGVQK